MKTPLPTHSDRGNGFAHFDGDNCTEAHPTNTEDLREQLVELYNESRRMGMLRVGSPIDHMVDGAIALLTTRLKKVCNEIIGEDEPRPTKSRYKEHLTRSERTVITRNVIREEQRKALTEAIKQMMESMEKS